MSKSWLELETTMIGVSYCCLALLAIRIGFNGGFYICEEKKISMAKRSLRPPLEL